MAASFCRKVAGILWQRLEAAALSLGEVRIALAGGVSANSWLRARAKAGCASRGWALYMPSPELCGDNAAMIAAQGYYEFREGHLAGMGLNGQPSMEIEAPFTQ
jgi:N6-L-threonylcarbamoyladenine synthase